MTELTFLLDLLLNHRLPAATKAAVSDRIREVEKQLSAGYPIPPQAQAIRQAVLNSPIPAHLVNQAPSTIAAMMKHDGAPIALAPPAEAPVIPAVIAQTPAAQQALASRNEAILNAGTIEKGRTRPRKF